MMLVAVIGKRFCSDVLRDAPVESEVTVEASVVRVLDSRAYIRAIQLHKFMSETCLRLTLRGTFECLIGAKLTEFHAGIEVGCKDLTGSSREIIFLGNNYQRLKFFFFS